MSERVNKKTIDPNEALEIIGSPIEYHTVLQTQATFLKCHSTVCM